MTYVATLFTSIDEALANSSFRDAYPAVCDYTENMVNKVFRQAGIQEHVLKSTTGAMPDGRTHTVTVLFTADADIHRVRNALEDRCHGLLSLLPIEERDII